MPDHSPSFHPDLTFCERCPPCIHAAFQDAAVNPLLVRCRSDEKGALAAFSFTSLQPSLVEVLHAPPQSVLGNIRHRHCSELLTVVSGMLDMYLLCTCGAQHLFCKPMRRSDSVYLPPGTAHAFHALSDLVVSSIFLDGDPRLDGEQVALIGF